MQIVISEYDRVNHHPTAKAKNKFAEHMGLCDAMLQYHQVKKEMNK